MQQWRCPSSLVVVGSTQEFWRSHDWLSFVGHMMVFIIIDLIMGLISYVLIKSHIGSMLLSSVPWAHCACSSSLTPLSVLAAKRRCESF